MKIIFTHHAQKKFKDLLKTGIRVSKRAVLLTIKSPENIDEESDKPKIIASRPVDLKHVYGLSLKLKMI